MVLGIRTPVKASKVAKSPVQSNADQTVRRSLDRPEAMSADRATSAGTSFTQPPPPSGVEDHQKEKPMTERRSSTGSVAFSSPGQTKCADRTAEAKANVTTAKLHLNNSRNTKTEIKTAVLKAIDRLYVLVKEAEIERKKSKTEDCKKKTLRKEPEKAPGDTTFVVGTEPTWKAALEEHTRLLKESTGHITDHITKLRTDMEKYQQELANKTYASVVSTTSTEIAKKRSTLLSVVVSSKNEDETAEEVLEKVRKTVDAKEGWVKVEKIRKAKNKKVIIGFETEQERKKVKDRLEQADAQLSVETVKNKDPMLALRDVLQVNTDEDIKTALRNQNREIFCGLDEKDNRLEIKYRRRARNPHTSTVVMSVSPVIWQRALQIGRVRIDLQRVRVEDQSPLVQCTRCLGYGHSKKYCGDPVDLCSHCGGPHLRAECADRLAGEQPSCRNCIKAKLDHTEHNAFSQDCPIRRRWDEIARATVSYC